MRSDYAMGEIARLEKKGYRLTPEDVIRLNGLGLKIERSAKCGTLYEMPRVAYLGKLAFREPTIAHVEWIDMVRTYVNQMNYDTVIAVHAFAMSRDASRLPEKENQRDCTDAIGKFVKGDLSVFTFDQVKAAVIYALHGADAAACEYPKSDKEEADDVLRSIGTGVMLETAALGLGISIRDIATLTVRQAKELQKVAIGKALCAKIFKPEAESDFQLALYEIEERLKAEKEKNGGESH